MTPHPEAMSGGALAENAAFYHSIVTCIPLPLIVICIIIRRYVRALRRAGRESTLVYMIEAIASVHDIARMAEMHFYLQALLRYLGSGLAQTAEHYFGHKADASPAASLGDSYASDQAVYTTASQSFTGWPTA